MPFDYAKIQENIEERNIRQYKCPKCKKLLFEGNFNGVIIKNCPKCKKQVIFEREKEMELKSNNIKSYLEVTEY